MVVASKPRPYPCHDDACDKSGHDPSAMQRTDEGYYVVLVTGSGGGEAFGMKYLDPADYNAGWRQGDNSYLIPPWLQDYEPWQSQGCGDGRTSACPFWAPDLPSSGNGMAPGGDHFTMYYSAPALDNEGSGCIGLARGVFHAPEDSDDRAWIEWTDAGEPVICGDLGSTGSHGGPHNIDPSVSVDDQGRWWMTYGSWSSTGKSGGGIWSVELDAKTGLLGNDAKASCGQSFPYCWSEGNAAFHNVANNPQLGGQYDDTNALEASYLYARGGQYYLFVNYFWCCRGMDSTYEIHVGRSTSPTGPFLDRSGVSMAEGGSEALVPNVTVAGGHTMVGPGHAGIMMEDEARYVFTFDFMAVDSDDNTWYQTQARELFWGDDGWPSVGSANFIPASAVV